MEVSFEVSAKAARLIGRENIAEIDGALMELIKNAYDADASCVFINFYMPFPDIPTRTTLDKLSTILSKQHLNEVLSYYNSDSNELIRRDDLNDSEKAQLFDILFSYNKIMVADNGTGMSESIIKSSWMQIATSEKEKNYISAKGRVKTGAKGIGRFALDKLSRFSTMYTKNINDNTIIWSVDWDQFTSVQLLKDVHAIIESTDQSIWDIISKYSPKNIIHNLKKYDWTTGTVFLLSPTREPWSNRQFKKLNTNLASINPLGSVDQFDVIVNNESYPDLSYITEPVSISENDYDYKMDISFNGINTLSVVIKRNEFDSRNKKIIIETGDERHNVYLDDFWNRAFFNNDPYTKDAYCEGQTQIHISVDSILSVNNLDRIRDVGPFEASLFFIKNGNSDFPFVKEIKVNRRKNLLKKFTGIKLYRDSFKVRPYGDEGLMFDWLDLDGRANRSPASVSHQHGQWRVRSYQLIGWVKISRDGNPFLYDTANRDGLVQNENYHLFVRMLQMAVDRFEFDRQLIYREYNNWINDLNKQFATKQELVKKDIATHGINPNAKIPHSNEKDSKEGNNTSETNHFTEQDYRATIHDLMDEAQHELDVKQLLESYSSSGVILNTFFHEFKAYSTELITRNNQMSIRLKHLFKDHPYSGPDYFDPFVTLDYYKQTDDILGTWLNVTMDSIKKNNLAPKRINISVETETIIGLWRTLLESKRINIEFSCLSENMDVFNMIFPKADLYIILNNCILNSVWFLEHSMQETRNISIRLNYIQNNIIIQMENNGPPLAQQYKDQPMRIFEIGESSKDDAEKTGIGLWLVNETIKRHSGHVKVLEKENGFGIEAIFPAE